MEAERDKIFAVHSMLHLIFHRNKNQHANSKWWKWLSILKRATLKLGKSLQHERLRSKAVSPASVHIQYLATQVVPKCYLAFSTVVADGQFSTLGIVLLATLARLSKVVGTEKELKRVSREKRISDLLSYDIKPRENEDVGEILNRDLDISQTFSTTQMQSSHTENPPSKGPSSGKPEMAANTDERKPRKKSRKKKDAIDDLFDGLL